MRRLDASGDGKISFEEFLPWYISELRASLVEAIENRRIQVRRQPTALTPHPTPAAPRPAANPCPKPG